MSSLREVFSFCPKTRFMLVFHWNIPRSWEIFKIFQNARKRHRVHVAWGCLCMTNMFELTLLRLYIIIVWHSIENKLTLIQSIDLRLTSNNTLLILSQTIQMFSMAKIMRNTFTFLTLLIEAFISRFQISLEFNVFSSGDPLFCHHFSVVNMWKMRVFSE